MKNNKGITLIALIITIIVMLILASVTISLILGEDGIISRAKKSSDEYNISQIKEQIQLYETAKKTDKYISSGGNKNSLPEGIIEENGTYVSNDGHTFYVEEPEGEVKYLGKVDDAELKEVEEFLKGKSYEEIVNLEENIGVINATDDDFESILLEFYIKYKQKIYRVKQIWELDSDENVVVKDINIKFIYQQQGLEGKKVAYTYKLNTKNPVVYEEFDHFKDSMKEDLGIEISGTVKVEDFEFTGNYVILYDDGEYVEMVHCDPNDEYGTEGNKILSIEEYNAKIVNIQNDMINWSNFLIDEEFNPLNYRRTLGTRYKNVVDTQFHEQDMARLVCYGEKLGYKNKFWLSNYIIGYPDGERIESFYYIDNLKIGLEDMGKNEFKGNILRLIKIKKSLIENNIIE